MLVPKSDAAESEEHRRFVELTKRLLAVPKSDLDERMAEYKKQRQARKRKKRER